MTGEQGRATFSCTQMGAALVAVDMCGRAAVRGQATGFGALSSIWRSTFQQCITKAHPCADACLYVRMDWDEALTCHRTQKGGHEDRTAP